jgi:hypothetical protein
MNAAEVMVAIIIPIAMMAMIFLSNFFALLTFAPQFWQNSAFSFSFIPQFLQNSSISIL